MRNFFNSLVATFVVAGLCVAGQARAQDPGTGGGGDLLALTTSTSPTSAGITTTAGIVVLIIVLVARKDEKPAASQEAVKATELYLRQNSVQLAQDLATGDGPVIQELARGLQLRPESARAFSSLLRQHRASLIGLSDADALSPARAEQFVQHLVAVMNSHPALRSDLESLAARTTLN